MANRTYGETDQILTRTGAKPATFGFDTASNPDQELQDFVQALQTRATSMVERYCGRRFDLVEAREERLTGNGAEVISVDGDPIVQIQSVKEDGQTLSQGDDYELATDALAPDEGTGRLRRLYSGRPGRWRRGSNIVVEYDYGYADADRPEVVDKVVEDMVVLVLNEADALRQSAAKDSESMDGYSVSWSVPDAADRLELTESMERKLDRTVAVQGVV